MTECHTADLSDMSSFVGFRQSTYDHVRVSDCLNLKIYALACVDYLYNIRLHHIGAIAAGVKVYDKV